MGQVMTKQRIVIVPELCNKVDKSKPSAVCDLLESENLDALLALGGWLKGKVDVIYIDPPYNTGSVSFAYLDSNKTWKSFMTDRLAVASSMLSKDGVIFISIDDNEQHRLRIICDEIFGEDNFIANFVWHKTKKGKAISRTANLITEYVLCYAKNKQVLTKIGLFGRESNPELANPLFHRPNNVGKLTFPANVIDTNYQDGEYAAGVYGDSSDSLTAEVLKPFTVSGGKVTSELVILGRFRWVQGTLLEQIAAGTRFSLRLGKFRIVFYRNGGFRAPPTLLDDKVGVGTYEQASAELCSILGYLPFAYPKPVSLIKYLVKSVTFNRPNAVVLDFFAGTGTTGHAVAELNSEDGGDRRCILITDNSGKVRDIFVSDAENNGICRGIARPRLLQAFDNIRRKSGKGTKLNYWKWKEQ